MRPDGVDVIVLAGAGLLLLFVLVLVLRSRRGIVRRMAALVVRLDAGTTDVEGRGVERTLARLERAANAAMGRVHEASATTERLRQVLAPLPQAIVVCDDGGEVVLRNERAGALVGSRPADLLAEQVIAELLEAALRGERPRRTLELFGPPRRMLTVSAHPLDDGWRTIGAVAVVDDVSARRHLDAVRRDFVANMGRELKGPVGRLALLAETLAGEDDVPVAHRLAQRVQQEAVRAGRIIDDLLDLCRIEAEESPLREPVPVHLVVAQAMERVRRRAEERGVRLVADDVARRLTVLGDRPQLAAALANLLENAVAHSDEGSAVEVRVTTDGRMVDVVVRDEGVGVPPAEQERIFERFYRVDRGRGPGAGGVGLGLAIVRHVADHHGGDVSVQSEEGAGAAFTLRLPVAPGPVAVSVTAADAAADAG